MFKFLIRRFREKKQAKLSAYTLNDREKFYRNKKTWTKRQQQRRREEKAE